MRKSRDAQKETEEQIDKENKEEDDIKYIL